MLRTSRSGNQTTRERYQYNNAKGERGISSRCVHKVCFIIFVSVVSFALSSYYNAQLRQTGLSLDQLVRGIHEKKSKSHKNGDSINGDTDKDVVSAEAMALTPAEEEANARREIYLESFPTADHNQIQTFQDLHARIISSDRDNSQHDGNYHDANADANDDANANANANADNNTDPISMMPFPKDIPRPRNLNILFMGDSLSRFQYLDLAYFLTHGTWIDPQNDSPSMVTDHDYKSWIHFFNHTNDVLRPHEQCDCFRKTSGSIVGGKGIIENRYFRDEERNNTVTYLQKFGDYPFKSSWDVSDVHNAHGPMSVKLSQLQPLFWIGWVDAIRDFVCQMKPRPSVFVFNQGWWTNNDLVDETLQKDILQALKDCDIVSIYKTTNKGQTERDRDIPEYESQLCANADYCLNNTWTALVPEDHYVDRNHFFPPIYTWMNLNLLSLLSSIESVQM